MSLNRIIEGIVEHADVEHVRRPLRGVAVLALHRIVDLAELNQALGLVPTEHDKDGKVVWDINPSGAVRILGQPVARSHTSEEFTWHTDASFEPLPPNYFMLQVLRGDQFGGGIQSFIDTDELTADLPDDAKEILATTDLTWNVPPEFRRDDVVRELPLLFTAPEGDMVLRYRKECMDAGRLSIEQAYALDLFEGIIRGAKRTDHTPAAGELAVVDNWRTLHRRSEIKDVRRHLQRIRLQ